MAAGKQQLSILHETIQTQDKNRGRLVILDGWTDGRTTFKVASLRRKDRDDDHWHFLDNNSRRGIDERASEDDLECRRTAPDVRRHHCNICRFDLCDLCMATIAGISHNPKHDLHFMVGYFEMSFIVVNEVTKRSLFKKISSLL